MALYHRPRTRLQTESETLRLHHLPEACISLILAHAEQGAPWAERSRLAEVCRAFRHLFAAQAFAGRPLRLDLNTLSWRLTERKRKAQARAELVAAVARFAPSVTHLCIKYQLDRSTGLALSTLLAPLAPRVRQLEVEDGLCVGLLDALRLGLDRRAGGGAAGARRESGAGAAGAGGGGGGGEWAWRALEQVSFTGCNLWIDLEPPQLATLEQQMAALPQLCSRVVKFECSCQGMQEGGEAFFDCLTALRSLELEDWAGWDAPRNFAPLRGMPHLTRLGLNVVEDLPACIEELTRLTQVQELSIQGCYQSCRDITRLTNLVMLDLQELGAAGAGNPAAAGAAWKVGSLTEMRWCGDLVFDEPANGAPSIQLPRLVALEIDEAVLPPAGFPPQLCTALPGLTSLRLVGGRCTRLPPAISQLANLQVLALDSCQLPAIPPSISCLTAVTSLQLSNMTLSPHLPPWVLSLPVRKLWVASNQLSSLLPAKAGRAGAASFAQRKAEWLSRLTHVCLYSNSFREVPTPLLRHAAELVELDMSYNHHLQISGDAVGALRELTSLRLLRLEKSYWLRLEDRWSRASLRAIAKLQRERPDLQVDYQHQPGSVRLAW